MSYEKLNTEIVELVGGRDNIKAVSHCMTRLRFTLYDRNKAQSEAITKLEGVIDVVSNDVAYQIIIGTNVSEVYAELIDMIGMEGNKQPEQAKRAGVKGSVQAILAFVSESMTPVLPALIASGMLAGILAVLSLVGLISTESSTYQIFDTLRGAVFTFLPVFIGVSAANRLKVNQYIAMILALTLMSETINGVDGLTIFGYHLPTITYAYTFIPILLGVGFLRIATTYISKIIPKSLHYFLVPMLSLAITLPVTLTIFGPLGDWIGIGLNGVFNFLGATIGNWIVLTIYAAVQPFLIVLGAANFVYPVVMNFFATLEYDPIFSVASTISDIAVCGAMFGYFLRTKNRKEKQTFGTLAFSALMGTTEPAVFGVFVKYRRPFLAVVIGGGLGGLIAGLAGVRAMSLVWGVTALPTYLAGGTGNFVWMMIASVTAFVGALFVAYGVGIPETEPASTVEQVSAKELSRSVKQEVLTSVTKGQLLPLNEVTDGAFASGALGKGIAIVPNKEEEETIIYAPVTGTVEVVFPTKHAYGLKTESGIEVLIHIGIDTVNLEGQYFNSIVTQGQKIQQGEILGSYEARQVQAAGFDPVVMVVITNTADYLEVVVGEEESSLLTVIF